MKMCSCLTVKTITIENHSRLEVQYAITEVAAKVSWTRESGITAGYLGTGVSANVTQSVESRDIPIQTDRLQAYKARDVVVDSKFVYITIFSVNENDDLEVHRENIRMNIKNPFTIRDEHLLHPDKNGNYTTKKIEREDELICLLEKYELEDFLNPLLAKQIRSLGDIRVLYEEYSEAEKEELMNQLEMEKLTKKKFIKMMNDKTIHDEKKRKKSVASKLRKSLQVYKNDKIRLCVLNDSLKITYGHDPAVVTVPRSTRLLDKNSLYTATDSDKSVDEFVN